MEFLNYVLSFVVNGSYTALVVILSLCFYNAIHKKVFKKSIIQAYKDAFNKESKS